MTSVVCVEANVANAGEVKVKFEVPMVFFCGSHPVKPKLDQNEPRLSTIQNRSGNSANNSFNITAIDLS